jgi:hypothetical protein
LWFALLVGICGLAVDITDGFRNKTMLQASVDAAALAAVIELPDESSAVDAAVAYADTNMPSDLYGAIVLPENVETGVWDQDTRTFEASGFPAGTLLNAVRVNANQTAANGNAVPVNFLRIIGLMTWDVRTHAVAEAFHPLCLRNGLTARGIVDISSNNAFSNRICIHGQQGVEMQNHNTFDPGTEVSMPDLADLTLPSGGMDSNPGLRDALAEVNKDPRLVNHVDEIMADYMDPGSGLAPSYIDATKPVIVVDDKFDLGTVLPHRIYHVACKANKNAAIPSNAVIQHVVIIADCELNIGSGAFIFNAVLGSRSGGTNKKVTDANVSASSGVQLGLPDNCNPGGGVQIYSNGSMHFSSTTKIDGVQMVAAGDIALGASANGVNGISAQAGGDIGMTSNNMFGLCSGGTPQVARYFYWRLVQ